MGREEGQTFDEIVEEYGPCRNLQMVLIINVNSMMGGGSVTTEDPCIYDDKKDLVSVYRSKDEFASDIFN